MVDIPGYEGFYAAAEDGRIWSHRKKRFLKPCKGNQGRYWVWIENEAGQRKHAYVHRLIGLAFIPNPEGKPEINHIDANPGNNALSNLEWVTHKENAAHACRMGKLGETAHRRFSYKPHRPSPKGTGAHFPLRPDQKHLIPVLRDLIDSVRGVDEPAASKAG